MLFDCHLCYQDENRELPTTWAGRLLLLLLPGSLGHSRVLAGAVPPCTPSPTPPLLPALPPRPRRWLAANGPERLLLWRVVPGRPQGLKHATLKRRCVYLHG